MKSLAQEVLDLLTENFRYSVQNFKDMLLKSVYKTWITWNISYPEEKGVEDPAYMEPEFNRRFDLRYAQFWLDAIKDNRIIQGSKRCTKSVEKTVGRCYYNAMDNSIRNGYDLAYGFAMNGSDLDIFVKGLEDKIPSSLSWTLHVFNIDKGKIIDPTLGNSKDFYFYKIVPKEVWSKFPYKANDPNQDARKLDDYMQNEFDKKNFNFVKEFRDYVNRQK